MEKDVKTVVEEKDGLRREKEEEVGRVGREVRGLKGRVGELEGQL